MSIFERITAINFFSLRFSRFSWLHSAVSRGQKGEETNRTHCLLFVTHLNLDNQCVIYRVKKNRETRGERKGGRRDERKEGGSRDWIRYRSRNHSLCYLINT